MSTNWVLKLPQCDQPAHPILVYVNKKEGGHKLDLDLLATDGDSAYRGKVRERSLKKLRSKHYEGTDEEWSTILQHSLVSRQNSNIGPRLKGDLDVDCTLAGKGSTAVLMITFRSRVEDITHKLGTIELLQTLDADDVDLFGWACQAVEQRDRHEDDVAATKEQAQSAQETITALESQLADLVKAKAEHETQLLSKFALLLNEKKFKIRNQQRILRTAKIDKSKVEQLQLTIDGDQVLATPSRRRGRDGHDTNAEDTDESDGFETMDIDRAANGQRDIGSLRRTTPSPTPSTATASEDENDLEPPADSQFRRKTPIDTRPAREKQPSPLPPTRALPFQNHRKTTEKPHPPSPPPPSKVDGSDEETASEDDEL